MNRPVRFNSSHLVGVDLVGDGSGDSLIAELLARLDELGLLDGAVAVMSSLAKIF